MYNKPDMSNPEDKLAWIISEIINDSAPIGWEKYRPLSFLLIKKFDMVEKEQMREECQHCSSIVVYADGGREVHECTWGCGELFIINHTAGIPSDMEQTGDE